MKKTHRLEASSKGVFAFSGLPSESAQTHFLAHLDAPNLKHEAVLWFVSEPKDARRLASLFRFWTLESWPDPLLIPGETPDSLILWHLLNGQPGIVFLPISLLDQPTVSPETFSKEGLSLRPGVRFSPAEICAELVRLGYDFNTKAEAPGYFARRGNLVDVWPIQNSQPVRIEFGQTVIDSLTVYDRITGKIGGRLEMTQIIPARVDQYESASIWLEYLKTAKEKKRLFIYADPDELDLKTPHWSEVKLLIKSKPQIIFYPLPETNTKDLEYSHAPLYHGNYKSLLADLKKWQREKYTIYFPDSLQVALADLWREHKQEVELKAQFLSSAYLDDQAEGFIWQANKTVFLTKREIVGLRDHEPAIKKHRLDLHFIAELKPNDYVVHLDHGIGHFRGLVKNVVDGIPKEYFLLEYAAKDKLSVPIELAYKIDKYIGSEVPKIHRLSNTTWYQMKCRISQEAKKIAGELLQLYAQRATATVEPWLPPTPAEIELEKSFPFDETPDQLQAIREVSQNLEGDTPMDRLICGDVGFGKTEVAIRAAFKAVMNGKQVAVMAPTTILAQQHYDTFVNRLKKFPVKIESLSRFKTKSQQKEVVAKLKTGEVDIAIGTHRLLSSDIEFKKLGLIIIDEEQRFGVQHKEKLKSLRVNAHILTLTATPIPRTLNLGLSTLRDMSVIRTPPEGRQPIETIIQKHNEETVKKAVNFELARGGQVYFLYNRVETINLKANQLKELVPKAKIGVIHGQLPESQLAHTMSEFDNRKINVLVSTTIIENGLDLPNVNTLIVEDATRFGLAQLYQLRGRIGRGDRQAYAYFLYPQRKLTGEAKKRLQAILEAKELGSGFQLALRDLEIRGVGNILGSEQHGRVNAVGLSLYTRLLSQAIEEIRTGQPAKILRDIAIDLPLPITIPADYIPLENQRLKVYRELSEANELSELDERLQGVEKQYGNLPPNVKNLHWLLKLRLLAQDTNIACLDTIHVTEAGIVKPRLVIKFNAQYTPPQIKDLLDLNSNWVLGENQVKIDFELLDKKWALEIEQVVEIFRIKE
ncbi:MAG: transcription-repair coupling factor [Patescibacteria group bacterium]|nr:transcription-repair coupling factor [Patescibacteria group bacterium]